MVEETKRVHSVLGGMEEETVDNEIIKSWRMRRRAFQRE